MTLGLSLPSFTTFHVVLSLVGIGVGFLVITNMLRSRISPVWNAVFLVSTLATALTGFLFPVEKILPSHIVGILTTVALLLAIAALYVFKLRGPGEEPT
jgi:drug/metabolite transporter (DMT)-like permease